MVGGVAVVVAIVIVVVVVVVEVVVVAVAVVVAAANHGGGVVSNRFDLSTSNSKPKSHRANASTDTPVYDRVIEVRFARPGKLPANKRGFVVTRAG